MLEESNQLELRVSALDEDIEDMETSDEEDMIVRVIVSYCGTYYWFIFLTKLPDDYLVCLILKHVNL